MQENTIRNLVEILGTAIRDQAAGKEIDVPTIRTAVVTAVQEAASPLFRANNYDLEKAVVDVLGKYRPRP